MLTYADVCWRMLAYADVCWRARLPLRQHLPAYVIIREHTSATGASAPAPVLPLDIRQHTLQVPELAEDVSIRQHTPAYASIRQHTARATAPAPLLPLDMLPHAGEVDLLHRRVAGR